MWVILEFKENSVYLKVALKWALRDSQQVYKYWPRTDHVPGNFLYTDIQW